jgi:hypothetical protein
VLSDYLKKPYFTLILCCIAFSISDSAQAQSPYSNQISAPTLEDRMLSEPSAKRDGKFWTFNLENDLFGGSNQDKNYTSGARLSYHNAALDVPTWARRLGEVYPGFRINDTTAVTYSLGQNLYTPEDITTTTPDPDDRPYAGWLYASAALSTITDNHEDQIELALGVVGPAALGKQTQNFVHNHITTDADDPQGWDSQLDNEPGLILSWSREYPQLWSVDIVEKLNFSAAPSFGTSLGNVYTLAQAGMAFRMTPYEERYADLPARVRPSIPGKGYFPKPDGGWSWGVFGGITGYAVARNIFLDGNTWESSPSVDKKNFVYDASAGLDLTIGNNRIAYTIIRRSKEFDNQEDESIFGSVSYTRRF